MPAAAGAAGLGALFIQRELSRRRLSHELAAARDRVEEHRALQRIGHAVARGAEIRELATLVAQCGTELLAAEVGLVLRFDDDGRGIVVGRSAEAIRTFPAPGEVLEFEAAGSIGLARATRRPARVAAGAPSPFRACMGERVAAPIIFQERLWGVVAVGSTPGGRLRAGCEQRLESFAAMVALAISNAEVRAQLVELASTDPLTGLSNSRVFEQRLAAEVERARRYGRPVAVALFDIDHFKQINDRWGHRAGDDTVVAIGQAIAREARADSLAARLGGDEFALLLPECSAQDARTVAGRILDAIRGSDTPRPVTASAGVADLPDAEDGRALLDRADDALYRAKASGRDACVVLCG